MRSLQKIVPVVLVLAFVVWLPSGSFAELAKWDQERVTALGAELSKACDALYDRSAGLSALVRLGEDVITAGSDRVRPRSPASH